MDHDSAGALLARLERPQSEVSTRLAVFADLHVSPDREGTWKMLHRTEERTRAAVADANARNVDGVVVAGDLTRNGDPAEFDRAEELLAPLDAPCVAIPGNHDVPTDYDEEPGLPAPAFATRFNDGALPVARRMGGVDVLALNTASMADGSLRDTWQGALSAEQVSWLREHLDSSPAPLVVTHHNIFAVPEAMDAYPWGEFSIRNPGPAIETLADTDAPLVISGHHHVPFAAQKRGITEVVAPAVCSFPQGYLLAEIDERGTELRLVPLADRDGMAEAHAACRRGDALGQGCLELAERGLAKLPLVDHVAQG